MSTPPVVDLTSSGLIVPVINGPMREYVDMEGNQVDIRSFTKRQQGVLKYRTKKLTGQINHKRPSTGDYIERSKVAKGRKRAKGMFTKYPKFLTMEEIENLYR